MIVSVLGTDFSVSFKRRRYGRNCYCWAEMQNGEEFVSCGDPWNGVHWNQQKLAEALKFALIGKVLVGIRL